MSDVAKTMSDFFRQQLSGDSVMHQSTEVTKAERAIGRYADLPEWFDLFFRQWKPRYFKRGDLARVMKISPEEAGNNLQAGKELDLVANSGQWWKRYFIANFEMIETPAYSLTNLEAIKRIDVSEVFANTMMTQLLKHEDAKYGK